MTIAKLQRGKTKKILYIFSFCFFVVHQEMHKKPKNQIIWEVMHMIFDKFYERHLKNFH